jgi:AcrR family transcriptional regulator
MRVTQKTKQETRAKLLEAARGLFAEVGFARATTREVAQRSGVAAGTLFNYFATKESLGAALLLEASAAAEVEFEGSRRDGEPLEETLFAWVAIHLRHLEPYRAWAAEVLEAGASLLRRSDGGGESEGERFRRQHLERVAACIADATGAPERALDLHLFWTLVVGVLEFWTRDESAHREATLALLDRSMKLFARSVTEDSYRT